MMVGVLLGIAAGFKELIRLANSFRKEQKSSEQKSSDQRSSDQKSNDQKI